MLKTQCYGNNEITQDYAYKENTPKLQQRLFLGYEIRVIFILTSQSFLF